MENKQFKIPFLKILDIFGMSYSHSIKMNQKKQKSILGAIASIVLIAISLCYLVYVMEQWLSLEILPKTSNTMRVEQFSAIDLNEDEPIIQLSFGKYSEQHRNPFDMQGNILMPIGMYFENGIPSPSFILKEQKLSNLKLIQNSLQDKTQQATTELVIMISRCQEQYLQEGEYCASETEISEFFTKSVTYMDFWINLKQYNPHKQEFEVVRKQYYFWFDSKSAQMGQLMIKQAYLQVDTGVLFNNYNQYKCIQDTQIMMTNTQKDLWTPLINSETYLSLIFRLDPVSFDIQIVYPKLGEILAQVGSIVNLLMIIRYLIQDYNQQLLENKLIDKLIKYYYFDYNTIKQSKDKKDIEQCNLLKQKAKKKLIFQNILYEISRIELFLLNKFGRNSIEQAHGYRIQCRSMEQDDNLIISSKQNSENLDEKNFIDFTILSKPEKFDKIHPI